MENKISRKPFSLIVIIFLIISLVVFAFKGLLQQWGADVNILLAGNLILFLATVFSFLLFSRGLQHNSTHAFLRMTYGGMLLRMGICIVATLVYAWATGGKVNKIAVFACFGFYFIYTFAEVKLLVRLSKQQKNA